MKVSSLLIALAVLPWPLWAQVGGSRTFDFLNLNPSARITALGGVQVATVADSALNETHLFTSNPALNNALLHQQMSLTYKPYYADVYLGAVSYAYHWKRVGQVGINLTYLDYGQLEGLDAAGLPTQDFSAQSYVLTLNYTHAMEPFRLGGNLKVASSAIGGYQATGLLLDLGGIYQHPTLDLTVGVAIQHLGFWINDYGSSSNDRLPTDARIGVSFKPQHMPFRFHLTAYHLTNFDVYQGENEESVGIANKVARHLSLGGELTLSQHFYLTIGYNHLIKSTLQLQQISGGAGLSYGFMFRTRLIRVDFTRAVYHVTGAFNQISLSTDLDQLLH